MAIARRVKAAGYGFAIILPLIALNHWAFRYVFDLSYHEWYLSNGTAIGFVTTFASLSWGDLSKHRGLISSHPLEYIGSCFQLMGVVTHVLSTDFFGKRARNARGGYLDEWLAFPIGLVMLAGVLAWIVVVAPLQYFVTLICGAPARASVRSRSLTITKLDELRTEIRDIDKSEPVPAGWVAMSIEDKPWALTTLLISLLLWLLKSLW